MTKFTLGSTKVHEKCPTALLRYSCQKLIEWSETWNVDDRPWRQKMFGGPKNRILLPPGEVQIRLFSKCDFEGRDCDGDLIGEWIMTFNSDLQVIGFGPLPPESFPEVGFPTEEVIWTYRCPVYFNCALSPTADWCVIVEIDQEGRVCRAVYELPEGVKSRELGGLVGEVRHERIKRIPQDLCLPAELRFLPK